MTVTLVSLKSGESITIKGVNELVNGSKWYWVECENANNKELSEVACGYSSTERYGKVKTKDYQLMNIEA